MSRIRISAVALCVVFAGAAPAADVEAFLPNDSEVVLSLNVEQLMNSTLGKKYLRGAIEQALKDNPQGADILKLVELDPFKDISRVTLAMWTKDNALVIVGGKFNRDKIADLASKAAADQPAKVKIHNTDGGTIYELVDDDKKSTFTAFASSAAILMSPDKNLLADLIGKTNSKIGKVKKELAALIAKADAKQTLWMAALPGITSAIPLPSDNPQQKQAVEGLESITGTLNVANDAKLMLSLTSKNPQAAQILNKQIIDGLNLVKLFLPSAAKDKPEIAPLLDVINTIRTLNKGKTVTITAEMTGEQIEKAAKSVQKGKDK